MKIVCFSKNRDFLDRYKECVHANSETDLDSLEDFILLLDLDAIKEQEKYFFDYVKLLSSCNAIFALACKPTFTKGTRLLSLGVKGYGDINMSKVKLRDALHVVAKGNIWLYPEFLQMMITSHSKNLNEVNQKELDHLSNREQEIASLIKKGLNNKEIAHHSNITERTVKAHLSSIYEKLNIKDRVALVIKLSKK